MEKDYNVKKSKLKRILILLTGIVLVGMALIRKKKVYMCSRIEESSDW